MFYMRRRSHEVWIYTQMFFISRLIRSKYLCRALKHFCKKIIKFCMCKCYTVHRQWFEIVLLYLHVKKNCTGMQIWINYRYYSKFSSPSVATLRWLSDIFQYHEQIHNEIIIFVNTAASPLFCFPENQIPNPTITEFFCN
jgi:hypothetical protein